MRDSNKNVKNLLVFIIILTSFFLGFYAKSFFDKSNLSENTKKDNVKNYENKIDLSLLWETYDKIKSKYYGLDGIKNEKIISGIVSGLVDSLGDKHSQYMTKQEKQSFEESLSGDFEGIGAVVEKVDNYGVKITTVIKSSPAEKSGIFKGDLVTEAGGKSLKDLNLYDAVKLIKGKAGTKVILTILRDGKVNPIKKEVTREKIVIPSVQKEIFEKENIGYLALNIFGDHASTEFKDALKYFKEKRVDGLILDLRNNGGGFLQSSVEILSEFIGKGEILVKTKYKDETRNTTYYSLNNGDIFDKKIVVLINSSSASASEITAGALREYNKAILVGEKTFGKGSVQEPFDLSDGGLLKLTIAKWFTPKGLNIDKDGIKPDVEILFTQEDYEKLYDRQLEEAKKVLKKFIENDTIKISVDKYNESKKVEEKEEGNIK